MEQKSFITFGPDLSKEAKDIESNAALAVDEMGKVSLHGRFQRHDVALNCENIKTLNNMMQPSQILQHFLINF
jgi:hypothetical protein